MWKARISVRIGVFVAFLMLLLVLPACRGLTEEPEIVATLPADAMQPSESQQIGAVMTMGAQIWAEQCMQCHGRLGEGVENGVPLPDLSARTDEQIMASLTNGLVSNNTALAVQQMPAFGDVLGDEQLNAVMTYAKMMSQARAQGMIGDEAAAESELTTVSGTVIGTVSIGTAGAALPESLVVRLHVLKPEFEEQTFETAMLPDGSYSFNEVPFNPTFEYVVTADYGDMMFVSDVGLVEAETPALDLPVTLYDTGADASAIQIARLTKQIGVEAGILQIVEIASFSNTSDRVYTEGVGLALPPGAQYQDWMGGDYALSDDGSRVIDLRPVAPGESRLMHIAYTMPYTDGGALEQPLIYALDGRVDVLVATDGLRVSSEGLSELGLQMAGGQQVRTYGGEISRDAGTSIVYTVTGTPVVAPAPSAATSGGVNPIAYVLIGAGLSAIAFAFVLMIRDRRAASAPNLAAQPGGQPAVEALMAEIADLDTRFNAGSLDERSYKQQRAALKARLTTLMKTR